MHGCGSVAQLVDAVTVMLTHPALGYSRVVILP